MLVLIGSGRLARHFSYYFRLLGLPFQSWSRNGNPEFNTFTEPDAETRLTNVLANSTHCLLALRDEALPEWQTRLAGTRWKAVHFSGATQIQGVPSAHPLMTFGRDLQDLKFYQSIPFVVEAPYSLAELIPGLPNAFHPLSPELKPLYHALCSLAGNSLFLFLQQLNRIFEARLNLPSEILQPFLAQTIRHSGQFENFTGPVARGDWATVRRHQEALHDHPILKQSYQTYLEMARAEGLPIPEGVL
ncbi:MAG: DUF2520 domain-containing protein [Bdellovibrionales bacterium]